MLHRLVGRAVLTVTHGVVREDEESGQLHQGREAHGRARVVTEDEERRAEGTDLGQREPVHDRGHRVLADAEMQVLPAWVVGLEASRARVRQGGLVRRPQIRRAPEKPGDVLREHVEHGSRGLSPGEALRVGRKDGEVTVPSGGQLAPLHLVDLGREGRVGGPIGREELGPPTPGLRATRADPGCEVLADTVGNEELGVLGPPVAALGEADLLLAERLAVGGGGVLLVRRAIADEAVQHDEGGTARRLPEDVEGVLDPIDVVGVGHPQDVPAVREEAGGDILREGDARAALDGDAIVVVDPAQVVEAEVAGQGGRLGRDALHQAAVPAHRVDVVVVDLEAGPVVPVGEPLPGDGHAHAGGDALPEGPRRGLDAGYPVVFRVPGGPAVQLPEVSDVVEGHRDVSQSLVVGVHRLGGGQVERPDRVLRIEPQDAVPDRVDERGERHRRAGVSGLRLLDRVDREGPDGVDRELVGLRVGHRRGDAGDTHEFLLAAFGVAGASTVGSCQPPEGDTVRSASLGPQVPGSYSYTGVSAFSIGSTTRHASST